MGAPRLRPLPAGPVLDGPALAELLGRPIEEIYTATRVREFPEPLPMSRYRVLGSGERVERSPVSWRWSRERVLAHIATPAVEQVPA